MKFMVLYYAPASAMEKMKDSDPEECKEGMAAWMAWAERCGDGLVDMGNPLANGQGVGSSDVNGVCGFSILQADSMDAAKALLDGHPHLEWTDGCRIEVYEFMPVPGQ